MARFDGDAVAGQTDRPGALAGHLLLHSGRSDPLPWSVLLVEGLVGLYLPTALVGEGAEYPSGLLGPLEKLEARIKVDKLEARIKPEADRERKR